MKPSNPIKGWRLFWLGFKLHGEMLASTDPSWSELHRQFFWVYLSKNRPLCSTIQKETSHS